MSVTVFLFKLATMPAVMTAATLSARRFGPAVGGLVLGLPVVSGPVSLFLAIEQGEAFARAAATGSLLGLVALAAFCAGFAHAARRGARWPLALLTGYGTHAIVTFALTRLPALETVAALVSCAGIVAAILACPRPRALAHAPRPPRWDLPGRIVVATAFMVAVTLAAETAGPLLSGVATTFPIMIAVAGPFVLRVEGAQAAIAVMRGCVQGLFSFVLFFLVLQWSLGPLSLVAAYLLALVASLACGAVLLALQRWRRAAR
jgi:hypothetical protein